MCCCSTLCLFRLFLLNQNTAREAGKDTCHCLRHFALSEILPLPCFHIDKCTRTHAHTHVLKLSLTLSDIHTGMLTHKVLFPSFLRLAQSQKNPLTHTLYLSVCVCYEQRERKKMKNEPNNVGPKAVPIKRINGSKVCKDGMEVLWLQPNINTSWVSVVERWLWGKKKNCTFCRK